MSESPAPNHWHRHLFRCPTKDILVAFTATAQGIRASLARYDEDASLTMQEAALIADRIREGRLLIEQIVSRNKTHKRTEQMMRIHLLQRDRLLAIVERCDLNVDLLEDRCRTYAGSATPGSDSINKTGQRPLCPAQEHCS